MKAFLLLEKLEGLYQAGNIALKPDDITYNTAIKCLARSLQDGAAEKAEECLESMKAAHKNGDNGLAPDCRTVSLRGRSFYVLF